MIVACVFCQRIQNGDYTPCDTNRVVRFEPLNPVVPGHMLFVPTRHRPDASTEPETTGEVFEAASRYGAEMLADYNLITSAGPGATQTVRHLHVHYVPRYLGDGVLLPWSGQQMEAAIRRAEDAHARG